MSTMDPRDSQMPGRLTDMASSDSTRRLDDVRSTVVRQEISTLSQTDRQESRRRQTWQPGLSHREFERDPYEISPQQGQEQQIEANIMRCYYDARRSGGPKAMEKENNKSQKQPRRSRYTATKVRTHNVQSANKNSKGRRWLPVLCATTSTTRYVGTVISIRTTQTHTNAPTAVGPEQQKLAITI